MMEFKREERERMTNKKKLEKEAKRKQNEGGLFVYTI
jgi:hypothetical protein